MQVILRIDKNDNIEELNDNVLNTIIRQIAEQDLPATIVEYLVQKAREDNHQGRIKVARTLLDSSFSKTSGHGAHILFLLSESPKAIRNVVPTEAIREATPPEEEKQELQNLVVYRVPSTSQFGVNHTVIADALTNRPISCTCEGFKYRNTCKHLALAVNNRRGV